MSITIKIKDMPDYVSEFPVTARGVLAKLNIPDKDEIVACSVNYVQRPLSWEISVDSTLEFTTIRSTEGTEVYARTLSFMLTTATSHMCNMRLHLRQSMNFSYFYDSPDGVITEEQVEKISEEMHRMVESGAPFQREEISVDKARAIMRSQGYDDKENLLRWANNDPVVLYRCEGIYDFFGGALADTAALIKVFEVHAYKGGIFLSKPSVADPTKPVEFKPAAKTFKVFLEYSKWLENLSLETMDQMFRIIVSGRSRDLIMTSEALHTNTLSRIAYHIEEHPDVRLLCLAGPSSSGKTTASRRLRVQLLALGINSATLELDNYFVSRKCTPRDENGKFDFESLDALDLDLINEHLRELLDGKEVTIPHFNFITGERSDGKKMKLAPGELLVIEGIHGLNEKLSSSVSADEKYSIFICPLTGTNIDMHNRIGTTDTRLLRRLVRDSRTRGHTAEATLMQWPSVIRGSFSHIFPYQSRADELFNTALAYELPVLKGYVLPLLKSVPESSPVFGEAHRLLSILEYVPIIPSDDVPNLSIIREFIGGSCFE